MRQNPVVGGGGIFNGDIILWGMLKNRKIAHAEYEYELWHIDIVSKVELLLCCGIDVRSKGELTSFLSRSKSRVNCILLVTKVTILRP